MDSKSIQTPLDAVSTEPTKWVVVHRKVKNFRDEAIAPTAEERKLITAMRAKKVKRKWKY